MTNKKQKRAKAPKVPFSFKRHILPPFIGLLTMVIVLGLLNGELIWARMHYHFSHRVAAATYIIQPTAKPAPAPKPDPSKPAEIIIPAINVHAPVVFDEPSTVEWKVQLALRRGPVHYSNTAVPGQDGTAV